MIARLVILLVLGLGCLLAAIVWFQPPPQSGTDMISVKTSPGELLEDSLLEKLSADNASRPEGQGEMVALPAPPQTVNLPESLKHALWDQEHAAFELETQLGRLINAAFQAREPQMLQRLFRSTERVLIPRDDGRFLRGPGWECRRWTVATLSGNLRDAQVEGLARRMIGYVAKFDTIHPLSLRVLSLKKTDIQNRNDTWWAHIGIAGTGLMADGAPTSFDSEHFLTCRFETDSELTSGQVLVNWSVRREEVREATGTMMREITQQVGLSELPLRDNWNPKWHPVQAYGFQTAVEDFDLDGDLDIAVCSLDGAQYLLRCDRSGRYVDAAAQLGLPADRGNGVAVLATWVDYDNDGFPDLLLGDALYHNDSGEKFVDVTEESGLVFDCLCMGVSVADYDADGLPDLYVLSYGDRQAASERPVGYVSDNDSGAENQLWQNLGNGRFLDVTQRAGVDAGKQHSFAAAWLYANEDEHPDLYVANEFGENHLFLNDGKGGFQDRAEFARVAAFSASRGVVAGDLNGDTAADLYVANMFARAGRRIIERVSRAEYPPGLFGQLQGACIGNRIYRRVPHGPGYRDVTQGLGVNQVGWAYAPAMVDLDGNGYLDLYAATGHLSFDRQQPDGSTCYWRAAVTHPLDRSARTPALGPLDHEAGEFWVENPRLLPEQKRNLNGFEPNRLYLNIDGHQFVDLSFESGAGIDADSRSSIVGDFDGDGDPDLLVSSAGGGPLRLFANEISSSTHRVRVVLRGVHGNRRGLGARVVARCGKRKIARDLFTQNGFMGQSPLELLIGLGAAEQIDELTVQWQGGKLQRFVDLPVDCRLTITEDQQEWQQQPFGR